MRRFNIICRRCGYKGQIDGLLHAVCPDRWLTAYMPIYVR